MRKRKSFFLVMVCGFILLMVMAIFWPIKSDTTFTRLDVKDENLIAQGKKTYALHCASCHGVNLEGQSNWSEKRPDGLYPSPPVDVTGHIWHHPDNYLITLVKYSSTEPLGYKDSMPAFNETLTEEEIIAVLTYIKSHWSIKHQAYQEALNRD